MLFVTRFTSEEEDWDGIEERNEEAEKGYRNYRECYNVHSKRILIELTQEMLCHLSRDGCYELYVLVGSLWRHGNFFKIL